MDNNKKYKFFLLVSLNQIKFAALNKQNEIIFMKEIKTDNSILNENLSILQKFLDQKIIEIEKNLQTYIEDICLILDDEYFLTVNVSSTQNFKNYLNQTDNISNSLNDLKNNLKKDMVNYEIIHLLINKFIIGGKNYSSIPKNLEQENIFLEIKFICLKVSTYLSLKSILSKYQITIKNILNYKYINNYLETEKDNIFDIAERLIGGLNKNEIILDNKTTKNKGFFEKFFNFFS